MTQATEPETIDLAIVSCETCDQLFLCSPRRESCPTCGGGVGLRFFEFQGDASGLHLKDGTLAALAAAPVAPPAEAPPAAPAAPAEREDRTPPSTLGDLPSSDVFPLVLESYLRGGEATEDDLRKLLGDLGAEPEDAAAAVGRLVAVRDLLRDLAAAGVEPAASVDVQAAPAESPPPAPEPAEGESPAAPEPDQAEGDQESGPSGSI